MPICDYRREDRLEIDFVILIDNEIVLIEVKSRWNTKLIGLNNILDKYNLNYGINLSSTNVDCNCSKVKYFPLYITMFIKNKN